MLTAHQTHQPAPLTAITEGSRTINAIMTSMVPVHVELDAMFFDCSSQGVHFGDQGLARGRMASHHLSNCLQQSFLELLMRSRL